MSRPSDHVVELNRTFVKIPDSAAALDAEVAPHTAILLKRSENWDEPPNGANHLAGWLSYIANGESTARDAIGVLFESTDDKYRHNFERAVTDALRQGATYDDAPKDFLDS